MAKNWYVGASSVAHKVKKAYVGVGGVAHKVKKAYIGDANGKARLCWTGKEYQYVLHGSDYKLRLYNINGTLVNTCTYGFNGYDAFIDYDDEQGKWFIACRNSNAVDLVGYWDGVATSITLKNIYDRFTGSHPELHNGRIYYRLGNTYGSIRAYNIATNTFTTVVNSTNNINYGTNDFVSEDYSRFYHINRFYLFYITGTTPTNVATFSLRCQEWSNACKSGNKLVQYGASDSKQLGLAVFDVKTKTFAKRTTNISLDMDLKDSLNYMYFKLLGIAFNRIYFTIPSTATNKSQLAYTPMFTSNGTFTYTLLDTARFSGQGGVIVGGDNIAIGTFSKIFSDDSANYKGYYRSTNGNTWTQVASPASACFYGGTNDHVDR